MKDSAPLPTVLVLGGAAEERAGITAALDGGHECLETGDADQAWALMAEHFVQVAICAGPLSGAPAAEQVAHLRMHWPETQIVEILGRGDAAPPDVQHAAGTLSRPWRAADLRQTVGTACKLFRLMRENERLTLEVRCRGSVRPTGRGPEEVGFEAILCTPGSPMAKVVGAARQYASFDVPILLSGEIGTGKAEMAEAIHGASMRSDKPFIGFDCSGLSDETVADALFGRRTAAAHGAPVNRAGLVRRADHGSLYLAGVETLGAQMQRRLFRMACDGVYEQEGASDWQTNRARLIVSVTGQPDALRDAGVLRDDLFYALTVAELALPPLRARRDDIPALVRAAADRAGHLHGKVVHGIASPALEFLAAYDWPGNLRELDNEVTRMLIHAQDPVLGPELISRHILQAAPAEATAPAPSQIMAAEGTLKDRVETVEALILRETLTRLKWNKSRSAAELGLSRVGLRAKLDRYGITPPQTEPEEA